MIQLKSLFFVTSCLVVSFSSIAQDKNQTLDFVSQQMAVQALNNIKALSTPDLIKAQAEYFRKMYDALIVSGFSKDEALSIVSALASRDK